MYSIVIYHPEQKHGAELEKIIEDNIYHVESLAVVSSLDQCREACIRQSADLLLYFYDEKRYRKNDSFLDELAVQIPWMQIALLLEEGCTDNGRILRRRNERFLLNPWSVSAVNVIVSDLLLASSRLKPDSRIIHQFKNGTRQIEQSMRDRLAGLIESGAGSEAIASALYLCGIQFHQGLMAAAWSRLEEEQVQKLLRIVRSLNFQMVELNMSGRRAFLLLQLSEQPVLHDIKEMMAGQLYQEELPVCLGTVCLDPADLNDSWTAALCEAQIVQSSRAHLPVTFLPAMETLESYSRSINNQCILQTRNEFPTTISEVAMLCGSLPGLDEEFAALSLAAVDRTFRFSEEQKNDILSQWNLEKPKQLLERIRSHLYCLYDQAQKNWNLILYNKTRERGREDEPITQMRLCWSADAGIDSLLRMLQDRSSGWKH